ncbi:MAG: HEPN domain-containing protein [Candidatus Omnitrophica bacterium]|nr:HEPN domain-containing protein [Candidatus Omnitrophota bacterium]
MDKKTVSLIKGYLEKAEEKLCSAETLMRNGRYDDAVSRAYYSQG